MSKQIKRGLSLIHILILFAVGFIPQQFNMAATVLVSLTCAMQVQTCLLYTSIGPIIAASVAGYFADAANASAVDELLAELTIERPQANRQAKTFIGKTFVITGSVEHFANRSELKSYIEERGGKVTGSVTKKTDYLIRCV